jgi:folate-dependent phosphoribosylglycinamide formyltransferase PurN
LSSRADGVVQYVRSRFGRQFAQWQAGEGVLTDSARYQDRASNVRLRSSVEHVKSFEAALTSRERGRFGDAISQLQILLHDTDLSDQLRAEAHFTLGDLLRVEGWPENAWLSHMVACLTFHENHELALSIVHRVRSDDLRKNDVAFANELLRQHRVVGIIQQYAEFPAISPLYRPEAGAMPFGISVVELRSFDDEAVLGNQWNALFIDPSVPMRYISRGEANSPAVLSWISRLRPDIIVSHGPERLGDEFIAQAPHGGINVHWGLSPRYRGMHTSRWALVHGAPEWVGVTVHKLDLGLDSGPILFQARPQFEDGDTIRRLEYRLTMLAASIVPEALTAVLAGAARAADQDLSVGKEYWLSEWAKEHEDLLTPKYIGEQVAAYRANEVERNRRAPLINPWVAHE